MKKPPSGARSRTDMAFVTVDFVPVCGAAPLQSFGERLARRRARCAPRPSPERRRAWSAGCFRRADQSRCAAETGLAPGRGAAVVQPGGSDGDDRSSVAAGCAGAGPDAHRRATRPRATAPRAVAPDARRQRRARYRRQTGPRGGGRGAPKRGRAAVGDGGGVQLSRRPAPEEVEGTVLKPASAAVRVPQLSARTPARTATRRS